MRNNKRHIKDINIDTNIMSCVFLMSVGLQLFLLAVVDYGVNDTTWLL